MGKIRPRCFDTLPMGVQVYFLQSTNGIPNLVCNLDFVTLIEEVRQFQAVGKIAKNNTIRCNIFLHRNSWYSTGLLTNTALE